MLEHTTTVIFDERYIGFPDPWPQAGGRKRNKPEVKGGKTRRYENPKPYVKISEQGVLCCSMG